MNPILIYAVAAAPQPVQPVVIQQPAPVVIYQAAPRPLFAPRPQVFVIQGQCVSGQCPK